MASSYPRAGLDWLLGNISSWKGLSSKRLPTEGVQSPPSDETFRDRV